MNKSSAVVAIASVGIGAGGSVNAYSDTADEAVIGQVGGGADIADSCNVLFKGCLSLFRLCQLCT